MPYLIKFRELAEVKANSESEEVKIMKNKSAQESNKST